MQDQTAQGPFRDGVRTEGGQEDRRKERERGGERKKERS